MAVPLVGEIVPDFALFSTGGARVRISDYRGKRNLALIFCGTGCSESVRSLLCQVSELYSEFVAEEAEVFAVVRGAGPEAEHLERSCALPFHVLVDKEKHAHDLFGAPSLGRDSLPVVCVVDRYGEVRHVLRGAQVQGSCAAQDILEWVRYINLECPE